MSFIPSKDVNEERLMHAKSDNVEIMSHDNVNDINDKLFESLRSRYQGNSETSMERSDFIFNSVQALYYKCHIINFGRGGSYIDSPDWIKKKQ